MSAISLKSITGITSITTPAGVDNQLTLHNNNTTEAVKLDIAGNLHFHNHLNITGISTAANFKTGTSNLHSTGLNIFDLDVDGHTNLDNVSVAGVSTFTGNADFSSGVDVTGTITGNNLTLSDNDPELTFIDLNNNPDYRIKAESGNLSFEDTTNGNIARLKINANGKINVTGRLDVADKLTVGHTNPSAKFTVGPTNGSTNIEIEDYGVIRGYDRNSGAWSKIEFEGLNYIFDTSGTEKLRITSDGDVAITTRGTVEGVSKLNVEIPSRTTAFSASDGDTWHDVLIENPGGATNNAVGLCFQVTGDSYHKNAGTGIAAVKNGTNSDYGANLVFITRPQNAVARERLRITSEGYLKIVDNGVQQTNTTLSYQYEGAFLTHYVARTTAGGDRYRRMFDIASVGANPHGSSIRLLTSPDATNPATTVERVRIDHNGRVGINKSQPATMLSIKAERSAVPRFGIDGHYSDSSYTQCSWDDSNGLYTLLGVNHKLDANGNDATPVSSLHSSSILLDGRSGSTLFYVKPNSGTTFTEAMKINKHGIVTTPKQPAFRSYTVQDGNSSGTVANIFTTGAADSGIYDLNDDFSESTGRFTAPVDGVYQVSIAWDENNSNTIIDLQINGSGAHYSTEARSSGSGWNSWFTSSTVYLDAGDYISINLRNATGSYPFHQAGGRWGHFSAHLVA